MHEYGAVHQVWQSLEHAHDSGAPGALALLAEIAHYTGGPADNPDAEDAQDLLRLSVSAPGGAFY